MPAPFHRPYQKHEPAKAEKRTAYAAALSRGKPVETYQHGRYTVELFQGLSRSGPVVWSAFIDPMALKDTWCGQARDIAEAKAQVTKVCR